ncbi:CRISPR-associated nuclease/helicase Cas3 subtype I-F/YPEST [Curvibacter sp. AEP1-3]|uniref:type I-F CRISPR-associated helicase Cas3f n=1 Tax=Curvibacter sp. AEP1-3 TaxID=1844971 RepID=UPI000B3C36AB|nr:type I-F CRISPR-associated helicase Cas3f [Curvibacter sp. AEP1-3]ARV18545.1 CRISPR-associated nuclease/helicase Cas3 subtype I-F/YPEST [Curvibacter sp. AEP1-3]
MNVLFVSQCSKRALTETRRILDQFAERRGERTWQTPITQAGLDTVRKLLRQTARKNTAVACHWIRGRDHSELLWVVGDASQFNDQGAVPTNTTASNVLRAGDENVWHHLPLMTALAALSALLHDLGKATQAFQDKLKNPGVRERNHYRHEWVSVRLFQAFVGQDDDAGWLQRLAAYADADNDTQALEAAWLDHAGGRLLRDGLDTIESRDGVSSPHNPFRCLPPLAQAVAWLVFTHHRLPCTPVRRRQHNDETAEDGKVFQPFGWKPVSVEARELDFLLEQINADWNEPRDSVSAATLAAHWHFPHGLPVTQPTWRKQAARYARKLLELSQTARQGTVLHDPFAMHVARLCLMLADHHYSSLTDAAARAPHLSPGYPLYANTRSNHYQNNSCSRLVDKRQSPFFNQTLDEHLLGVQAHATLVARSLPNLTRSLPALKNHKPLKKRSADPRFAWQDKAADLAASVRARAAHAGAFIVNMASTGCGKTLGNARVMNALADPATGLRCAFAMGLRTLTLQTGRVFQNDLQLSDEQLALQVGGAASRALFEYWEQQAEATGSASSQALLDEAGTVLFEGNDQHPLLQRLTGDAKARALIAAPLLVCTVDHLTPATESLRGGRQIAPMLRLLTSDLVLDEPDDFDMADLPALTRLVHWAGLLGSRVLLSSATLPPALVEGLFMAYRAGRAVYQRHRSERPSEPVNICCLWIDEFHQTPQDCADGAAFREAHTQYVHKRVAKLKQAEVRRLAQIAPLPDTWHSMQEAERRKDFARLVLEQAWELHQRPHNHSTDTPTHAASGKRVSLGLIRMANIAPLYDVALAMYAPDALPHALQGQVRIHLCVYHSQFPLLLRSAIEQQLDTLLNRRGAKDGHDPALHRPALRALIDAHPEPHHLFIVLGSPVTEVGRDHDYDWAVVEPSSMRSLIQLAGRVRRHRPGAVGGVNMVVLDSNLRHYEDKSKAAFCKPGFEMNPQPPGSSDAAQNFYLYSHSLRQLMTRLVKDAEPWAVDAQPRIEVATAQYHPRRHWADLEHERMRDAMLQRSATSKYTTAPERAAFLHWAHPGHLWLTGLLPQFQRFRYDAQPRDDVALLPDENEETLLLHRVQDGERRYEKLYVPIHQSLCHPVPAAQLASPSVSPWPQVDLMEELAALAQARGLSLEQCAERYATASLPESQTGWRWDERLGFSKKA